MSSGVLTSIRMDLSNFDTGRYNDISRGREKEVASIRRDPLSVAKRYDWQRIKNGGGCTENRCHSEI
jgi:hypothetical protein